MVTLNFAAAGISRIELGRSGVFSAKRGGRVELTPKDLADIAESVDPSKRTVRLKLGHSELETWTPDCGVALAAEYDVNRDRLFADIKPTEYLAQQNRTGAFTKISMELLKKAGRYVLDAIAFLGAHDPAIQGLEPVALARGGSNRIFLCCDGGSAELAAFAGADKDSVSFHLAATKEIEAEEAKGNALPYLDAVRRVEMARSVAFASADPASLELHHRVRALIMAEKEKGNVLSYLEAVRRVEREQAKT